MHKLFSILILLFIQLSVSGIQSQKTIVYTEGGVVKTLREGLYIYTDQEGSQAFDFVSESSVFKLQNQRVPNLGISNSVHWIRFDIMNNSDQDDLLLELLQPNIEEITLYYQRDNKINMIENVPRN